MSGDPMERALSMLWTYRRTLAAYAALLVGVWILWGVGAALVALAAIVALEEVIGAPLDHGPQWGNYWRTLTGARFWVRHVYREARDEARRGRS